MSLIVYAGHTSECGVWRQHIPVAFQTDAGTHSLLPAREDSLPLNNDHEMKLLTWQQNWKWFHWARIKVKMINGPKNEAKQLWLAYHKSQFIRRRWEPSKKSQDPSLNAQMEEDAGAFAHSSHSEV